MRISSGQIHNVAINSIIDQQATLSRVQQQIAAGRRILTPSDDPAGAARALVLGESASATTQFEKNSTLAGARLQLEEISLGSVNNLIQRVRELALQGNNDSQNNETRPLIASEIRQRLDELLSLANTRDANGEYIYAGFQSLQQAFTRNADGSFAYNGDEGQRFLQIGPSRQVAVGDSGTDVFRRIRNGNGTFTTQDNTANTGTGVIDAGTVIDPSAYDGDTYTISYVTNINGELAYTVYGATAGQVIPALPAVDPDDAPAYVDGGNISFAGVQTNISGSPKVGDTFTISPSQNQDLFTTIQNLAVALESGPTNSADLANFHNAMNRVLVDLDQGLDNILDIRAQVGARLNSIEDQTNLNQSSILQVQTTLAEIQDLDYAEAISQLEQQRISLQAAQQSFLRIQNLSLFNFL